MDVAVQASRHLADKNLDLLTITLTDERYGPIYHKDSNWHQLKENGFNLPEAKMLPVINGESLSATANSYNQLLNEQLQAADYSIALAGMGPDGHIFGIKPHSPAVDTEMEVVGYKWSDYERLTPTVNLIKRLDEVIIYAVGPEKHAQFDLLNQSVDPQIQPAQLLKQLDRVTIFNDYIGEEA
jgi:6-phosphogluconolactonase/glucosamine-6-phosphate isomerase/deaminase